MTLLKLNKAPYFKKCEDHSSLLFSYFYNRCVWWVIDNRCVLMFALVVKSKWRARRGGQQREKKTKWKVRGWTRVDLDRGIRRCRTESRRPTLCTDRQESMKEGCGDMGRVGEDDVESSKQSVRQACANDSKASRHDGRSDTCRHQRCRVAVKRSGRFRWFGPPNHHRWLVSRFGPQN